MSKGRLEAFNDGIFSTLRPKRGAYGARGLRSGSGQRTQIML